MFDPDQVEGCVYSRGRAGTRDHAPVFDKQHVWVDVGVRVPGGESIGVHPVSGRPAAVEDAGLSEHERAAANPENPRTARLGIPNHREESLIGARDDVRRHCDEVGVCCRFEPRGDDHVVAEAGPHRTGIRGSDGEVERRAAGVAAIDPENLAEHAEFERGDARQGKDNNFLQHETSMAVTGCLSSSCHRAPTR